MFENSVKKIHQATTYSLNYVDRLNEKKRSLEPTDNVRWVGETISLKHIPVTSTGNKGSQTRSLRQSADDTLEKSLKLLIDGNQSTVVDKGEDRTEIALRQTGSATLNTVKRRSLVDFSPSRALPKSYTCKPWGPKMGS